MLEKRIEAYWDGRADSYSELIKREMACNKKQEWESLLRKYAGKQDNIKVLDVGTGPGFFAILLAGMNYSVTAIDKCEEMLKQARKNAMAAGMTIKFMKTEAHDVALPNESFDLIVSRNVTWLLPNPLDVYHMWYRLLRPEGKVLVFDANWHLHLSDPELQQEHDKYLKLAMEKGYQQRISPEQQKENETIARKLPLTYEKRPLWDEHALRYCGFKKVEIQNNISSLVHDEMEQVLYAASPMFAICATK